MVRLLEQLGGALEAVKAGGEPRTQLELALVKAARPETDGSLGALLARLERLEGRSGEIGGGPPEAASAAFVAPGPARRTPRAAPGLASRPSERPPEAPPTPCRGSPRART